MKNVLFVAPFTGAWIEIDRESARDEIGERVAPFTGAWIEMLPMNTSTRLGFSRTLHGCVD